MPTSTSNIYYIPPGAAFAELLVAGVLARLSGDGQRAAQSVILLPNRRLTESVRGEFLKHTAKTTGILPRLLPLGDTDVEFDSHDRGDGWDTSPPHSLPPVIDPLHRQLLLARLIRRLEDPMSLVDAIGLARPLADLLDTMQTSGLDAEALHSVLPENLAQHWQRIRHFLTILTQHWPQVLADQTLSDPAVWRDAMLRRQAEIWQHTPPQGLVVIAGSTGSIPATRALMKVVAGLPNGAIVLPGVDMCMAEADWGELVKSGETDSKSDGDAGIDIGDTRQATHPQYQLACLLAELGVTRADLAAWPPAADFATANASQRLRLLSEVMRPVDTTSAWYALKAKPIAKTATEGMQILATRTRRDEAEAVALAMRETLTTSKTDRVVAITADRVLADMISDALAGWGVNVPNSSGRSLATTPGGRLLLLLTQAWGADFAAVDVLGVLQHPYVRAGGERQDFLRQARRLERDLIRVDDAASYHGGGLDVLQKHAHRHDNNLAEFITTALITPFAPLTAIKTQKLTLPDLAQAVAKTATLLTENPDGSSRIWQGRDGQGLARLAERLADYGGDIVVEKGECSAVLRHLLEGITLYPDYSELHPRLMILGLVEARMQTADQIILAGMNEETTPPQPSADPWMNQAMRRQLGLPHWEWRVGMVAQDVMMALANKNVLITYRQTEGGTPTQPSRWLGRLQAVLTASNLKSLASAPYAGIVEQQLAVKGSTTPATRPAPLATPDEAHQHMRKFSATQLEELVRDPYAIYARRVLGLKALPQVSRIPFPALKGTLFHKAIADVMRAHPKGNLPADAQDQLRTALDSYLADAPPGVWMTLFWRLRFDAIAQAFVARETALRPLRAITLTEIPGKADFVVDGGERITLTAHADRIDVMADGGVEIIDYKTGGIPSQIEVNRGHRPQLIVTAMIAQKNGFGEVVCGDSPHLAYWRLAGRVATPIETTQLKNAIADDFKDEDSQAVLSVLANVMRADWPFVSQAIKHTHLHRYSDYAHLARVQEWDDYAGEFGTGNNDTSEGDHA